MQVIAVMDCSLTFPFSSSTTKALVYSFIRSKESHSGGTPWCGIEESRSEIGEHSERPGGDSRAISSWVWISNQIYFTTSPLQLELNLELVRIVMWMLRRGYVRASERTERQMSEIPEFE